MKKTYIYLIIVLLLPLIFLAGCGKDKRPSLDDRIDGSEEQSVSYEGIIEKLESLDVYQQGTHKLVTEDDGTIILQSPSIDLNRYLDEEVLVKGIMEDAIGDAEDVFTVNEISYVDESKSAELTDYENKLFGFRFTHPSTWIMDEGQGDLGLKFEEKEVVSIAIFSDKTDLDAFAASREEGESTEVTIGAQRALRYVYGSQMGFYVPNPPKKKIYLIKYVPSEESQRDLFYDLLDSFEPIFLSQVQGEKCGGLKQIECAEEHICQLESDGKYAEGVCVAIGGDPTQSSCPFIAPPTSCKQYRISEYSQKGCPSRYECVGGETDSESASFRDLNNVDAGDIPTDYQSQTGRATEDSTDVGGLDDEGQADEVIKDDTEEKTYDIPDVSNVSTLYVNDRKGFNLLMPKSWYYASFGPVDGTLWKVGFSDFGLEETEEAIITLSIMEESGGRAYKKIDDLYYVLDGPSDLTEIMKKMADSVEAS